MMEAKELIEHLAQRILRKRDEAVRHRVASGVEQRWREDEETHDGLDTTRSQPMTNYATGIASPRNHQTKTSRSQVVVNIVRSKCEQTVGRFADIQLPIDDRNWGLGTTPIPELALQARDETPVTRDGQPVQDPHTGDQVTLASLAANDLRLAESKMKGMEKEIDDQLTECNFNAECRKALSDAVKLGTGILKGPGVIKQIRKAWKCGTDGYVLEILEEHVPYSKRVNIWNVFPDPGCGDDIKRAGYVWERDYILPRELRRLIGVNGYIDSQIYEILEEEPLRTTVAQGKHGLEIERLLGGHQTYELWEYHGDLSVEDISALGCDDCGGMQGSVSACVVFVNDKPIKAVLNTLDTGDLPYDFFQWTQVTDSVWGIGIPRILLWQQRIITAAWRMMMDNGRNSTRGHVVKGDGLRLVDNSGPFTLWEATGDMVDVRMAFGVHYFPSNQQELQNIIDLALRFVDLETGLPMAFHGEQVGQAETLGAVELKIDSTNVGIRSRVKLWDDKITRPHLTRYYHWNMQYNKNDDIKGDYNVDPRGVSVLLIREKAANSIIQLMQLRGDPLIGGIVDWVKAVKQLLSAQKVDILKSDEDIDQVLKKIEEAPPSDPRADAQMKVAQLKAEADVKKEQARQQIKQVEMQTDQQDNKAQRQHEQQLANLRHETELMKLASGTNQTLEQIKADLAKTGLKLNVQRELSLSARGGAAKQVATPPTEPAGRAKPGRAYQE